MTTLEPASHDVSTAAAAYPDAGETRRLRAGRLRFFRTIAESVGVQGPTGAVVIAPAILASVSGGGTALVELVAAVAMGFVAYAFVIFTRSFNSAGSVYGFTGAVAGPVFGFVAAWTLMLVYVSFAGGIDAATADEAQPAFGAVGLHLPWQVYAIIAFALVMALAYLDVKISASVILALEGVSMRDTGPVMLRRTSRLTGAPVGALIWVGAGSLLTLLLFISEPLATRAVALSLTYGSDLIIAAYTLVVIAAIIFAIRRRMAPVKTVILLIGVAVLGYVLKDTFVPLPAAPFRDALAAGITLAAGIVLPFVCPPLRRGIANSPLLKVGASALLGTRPAKLPVLAYPGHYQG